MQMVRWFYKVNSTSNFFSEVRTLNMKARISLFPYISDVGYINAATANIKTSSVFYVAFSLFCERVCGSLIFLWFPFVLHRLTERFIPYSKKLIFTLWEYFLSYPLQGVKRDVINATRLWRRLWLLNPVAHR